jgi:hypothetical protein
VAKKKPVGKKAKPRLTIASKKPTTGAHRRPPARRRGVEVLGGRSPTRVPREWQAGRIVPGKPPAKPLKGRGAERVPANLIRDAQNRPIPRKVCEWFVRKLDATHKVSVRLEDDYAGPKVPHISPEAAHLLSTLVATWARLAEAERDDAQKREKANLESLSTMAAPREFRGGKVVLGRPSKSVAAAHCWKPDFEGEVYQAVLHYYNYLPAEHVGSITDPNGYPAKVMSPEAARLYRSHRAFWEAKYAESRVRTKVRSKERRQAAEASVDRAATSAGLSRIELEAKLDRLGMLVEHDNLQLVAEMIAGFGDAWLYETLLAGSWIEPDGDLKPGKILKRFKKRASLVLVLAIAAMPDGLSLDPSLRRDAGMTIDVTADSVGIVAEIADRLPSLKTRWGFGAFDELSAITPAVANLLATQGQDVRLAGLKKIGVAEATALAKAQGGLSLDGLGTLDPTVADALAGHKGRLELGLRDLTAPIATCLASHVGDLVFPELKTISPAAAAALEPHCGEITLGNCWDTFTLDSATARHLGRHAGLVHLPGVQRLDGKAALELAGQEHGIGIHQLESFPAGEAGVRLCKRLAASKSNALRLTSLKALTKECATALATFKGDLWLAVEAWTDDALIAVAQHEGKVRIDPGHISDAVGRAFAKRHAVSCLVISEYKVTSLTDGASEALQAYSGELAFEGDLNLSTKAAEHLSQRRSVGLFRSKIKGSARKIFEAAGAWTESTWNRNRTTAKQKPKRGSL